ncbi:MAG: sigma 54-interacting transcriptional regulator [Aquitalea sp.]|nr:sigma 54-interacting transcriptional regulator [Aquitalea sp.]
MSPLSHESSLDTISRMLDELGEPRIVITEQFEILHANPAYHAAYGTAAIGRPCYEVSHGYRRPCNEEGESCPLQMTLASGQPERVLHIHRTAHGDEHVDVELMPLADISGHRHLFIEKMKPLQLASSQAAADKMVGRSAAFRHMLLLAQRAAPSSAAVLLFGESGTGKEGLARAIHDSGKPSAPFIVVDCASLSETLLESELFGYEKGAFTGANQRKQGLVEAAHGGTLFLDEIGDLPLSQQVKLLRLLESGSFRRVGGINSIPASFRLIAATHRNLDAMVADGSFRADLFYRLAVFPIRLPPLRERRDDIPLLCASLLERVAPGRALQLEASAMHWLQQHPFKGNIRELRNLLERASLLCDGERITLENLCSEDWSQPAATDTTTRTQFSCGLLPLDQLETQYLDWACQHSGLKRRELAAALQLTERTLYRRLAEPEKKTPAD